MVNFKCVVPGCKNTYFKGDAKRKFHQFPKDEARRTEWKAALKRDDEPPKSAAVCSDHFLNSDYKVKGEKYWLLEKIAIPTLNLGTPDNEVSPPPKRKRNKGPEELMDQAKNIIARINNQQALPSCS